MNSILLLTILNGSPNIDLLLQKIEKESGCKLTITSGYRSKRHNKRVGGAKKSYHLTDRARDFKVGKGCTLAHVAKIACRYASTILYSNHIHIDNRDKKVCFSGKYKGEK